VEEIGIEIRIAHYPPYTSKWNPIEHRVFAHITRELSGMILISHVFERVKGISKNTPMSPRFLARSKGAEMR